MYELKTTFWLDFTIADHFGLEAIKETYDISFKNYKHDVVYLTELVMVLNWKIWQHWEKENVQYANVYDMLWRLTAEYAIDNLKGEDLKYYLKTID